MLGQLKYVIVSQGWVRCYTVVRSEGEEKNKTRSMGHCWFCQIGLRKSRHLVVFSAGFLTSVFF